MAGAALIATGLVAAEAPANAAAPIIRFASTNAYPGAQAKVVVRTQTGSGAAIQGSKVMVTYPGQATQRVYTNSAGYATAYFTQRAGVSPYKVYVWLPGSASVNASTSLRSQGYHRTFSAAYTALIHKVGAYSVPTGAEVDSANGAGLSIMQTDQADSTVRTRALANGDTVMDAQLKDVILNTLCSAPRVCHAPTSADLATIAQQTQAIVTNPTFKSSATSVWQILDDYELTSFLHAEAQAYTTLRHFDSRPTVCAFGLHLAQVGNASSTTAALNAFKNTLVNYSPSICNAVTIYSFPPGTSTAVANSKYDWTLSTLLPSALAMLRNLGWNPATQPLFATPATFGYNPRYIQGTTTISYQPNPTATQLAQEINAFCSLGASSLLGYAWNDRNVSPVAGGITELYNNPGLRSGLTQGAAGCATNYWRY